MRENYQLMHWSTPYSGCQVLDQRQGLEAQQHAAIGPRLGQMIHEVVVGDLLEPLEAEGRAYRRGRRFNPVWSGLSVLPSP